MTGAITCIGHAKEMCLCVECANCKLYIDKGYSFRICALKAFHLLTDEEIADLVREVERWHKEYNSSTRDCN